ncbi:Hypothetical protein, conserved [Brucella abortus str. 2308 A]|uniref:Uncharacterized protein n=2 Tax=Brucella TaxID=234 RepID=C0RL97_BRUMB|nr:Hypothetical protein, conserved [Brucella melitensis ATCC 23457]EEH12617.1 Hypothetical protein, conserved [Brucella ceti str. Cudo]EEP62143.1 Hypothetical protein, conserved [Brucella abortus str. 2308 A]
MGYAGPLYRAIICLYNIAIEQGAEGTAFRACMEMPQ